MKILLISCHERLETLESKIYRDLGHQVTTIGFTMDKNSEAFNCLFFRKNPVYQPPNISPESGFCILTEELVKDFDLIIVQHYPHILQNNWQVLQKKNVIIRSIGMPNPHLDSIYDGFKGVCENTRIIRMSELESPRNGLIPQCFIPGPNWVGNEKKVLTVRKMFKKRAHEQSYALYEQVMVNFSDKYTLAGSENQDIPGCVIPTDSELSALHSSHAVYFYPPNLSSFVTFSLIEALAAGIPIVTASEKLTGIKPELIEHGYNGLIGNSVEEIVAYIQSLLTTDIGLFYSKNAKLSVEKFSYENTKKKWEEALNDFNRQV